MDISSARLVPVGGTGPEDVLIDPDGRVYTGLEDGRVVRLDDGPDDDGARVRTVATVPGRPLGLEFLTPDELVVCASDAGLLALPLDGGPVRVLAAEFAGRPLRACNNAAVGPDGAVYFSDSSVAHVIPEWRADLIERTAGGRLFRRDPGGEVTELLGGLEFANGVALAPDASFVAVAETGARRIRRVRLTGEEAGRSDVLVDDLPGYPDNIATGSDGLIWIAIPSPRVPALEGVQRLPRPVRGMVARLPEALLPRPAATVTVLAVDGTGRIVVRRTGEVPGFRMLTGVREAAGTLWFGSLTSDAVATMPRPEPGAQPGAQPGARPRA